jgi:hypothetical protein
MLRAFLMKVDFKNSRWLCHTQYIYNNSHSLPLCCRIPGNLVHPPGFEKQPFHAAALLITGR